MRVSVHGRKILAAFVFDCMPRRNVSQVLQGPKCEWNCSVFVFWLKINTTKTETIMLPKDKLGTATLVTPLCKHNSTNKTGMAGQVHAHEKERPDYRYVLSLENGSSGLRQVSVLFAFFGMVECNKAKHHGAPPLRATAGSSSAPPCQRLPSRRS